MPELRPPPTAPLPAALRASRLLVAVAAFTLVAASADAAAFETRHRCLKGFAEAWARGDADGVADCIPAKGTVQMSLFAKPLSGRRRTWTREQTRASLKLYFERSVRSPELEDVTPEKARRGTVRYYDYSYRPVGGDRVTTRLQVTVRSIEGRWALLSVNEARK